MKETLSTASSQCPICGVDKPHAHTRSELTARFRREALQKEFEKHLLHWFIRYKDLLQGSYGMGLYLDKKAQNGTDTYWWWPVEMIWKAFEHGAYFVTPAISWKDESLQMHEALQIKADPFGNKR